MKRFYVYLLASRTRVLYTGITNNLERRLMEHKEKNMPGFTQRYNTTRLVYYEEYSSAREAIRREKEIKGWKRAKKVALIESMNPAWQDLSDAWFIE
jgi:putative endonuclease